MNQKSKKVLGAWGEKFAAEYLTKQGYTIIRRNFQKRYEEIDIIARKDDALVFVEVKTRKEDNFGPIEEAVTTRKIQSLKRSIEYYLHLYPALEPKIRLDFLGIEVDAQDKVKKITHYEGIG